MTTHRLFVAVPLPKPVMQALSKVQNQMKATRSVRWVRPTNMHLTLQFIGDFPKNRVDRLAAMLEHATTDQDTITLEVEGLGVFPNLKRPSVIWIGLGGDLTGLHQLQKAIVSATKKLGVRPEKRPFTPHLTIGWVKRHVSGKDYVQLRTYIQEHQATIGHLATFSAQSVHLIHSELKSDGPVYTTLADLSLLGSYQQIACANSGNLSNTTR